MKGWKGWNLIRNATQLRINGHIWLRISPSRFHDVFIYNQNIIRLNTQRCQLWFESVDILNFSCYHKKISYIFNFLIEVKETAPKVAITLDFDFYFKCRVFAHAVRELTDFAFWVNVTLHSLIKYILIAMNF